MSIPDHWHNFTTIDQDGKQHHMAHSSIYIIAIISLVIIILSILLVIGWVCRARLGRLGTWMHVHLMDLQDDYREFRFLEVQPEPVVRYQRRGRNLPEIPRGNDRRGEQV